MGLFGKKNDPTADWPHVDAVPAIDLDALAFGPVKLGDPLEKARPLGRPRHVMGKPGREKLSYPTFQLEFIDGKLACVSFDLDEVDEVEVGDVHLKRATSPLDAQVWFGDPESDSEGDGLRWLDFRRGEATLALEFDERGLGCLQLYTPDYA